MFKSPTLFPEPPGIPCGESNAGGAQNHDPAMSEPTPLYNRTLPSRAAAEFVRSFVRSQVFRVHAFIESRGTHGATDKEIQAGLKFLEPDSYITEVAEERVELDTVGWGITPQPADYDPIADFLSQQAKQTPKKGIARFTQAFRAQYYQLAKRVLHEHDQVIPCYAGWASAHIAPNGDLWSCCIRAESVGNLREHNYDITPIWRSQAMQQLRGSIKRKECACPMANANYANMLLHPPTVAKVILDVARGQ